MALGQLRDNDGLPPHTLVVPSQALVYLWNHTFPLSFVRMELWEKIHNVLFHHMFPGWIQFIL